jgi:hypothetical protein
MDTDKLKQALETLALFERQVAQAGYKFPTQLRYEQIADWIEEDIEEATE